MQNRKKLCKVNEYECTLKRTTFPAGYDQVDTKQKLVESEAERINP
jgi:hypothetical protein